MWRLMDTQLTERGHAELHKLLNEREVRDVLELKLAGLWHGCKGAPADVRRLQAVVRTGVGT